MSYLVDTAISTKWFQLKYGALRELHAQNRSQSMFFLENLLAHILIQLSR